VDTYLEKHLEFLSQKTSDSTDAVQTVSKAWD
jgi:hypothetical protein